MLIGYDPIYEISEAIKKSNHYEFNKYLSVADEVDLVIRTGGGKLLSGFLPIQTIYSELFFIDKLFNDLEEMDIEEALTSYNSVPNKLRGK